MQKALIFGGGAVLLLLGALLGALFGSQLFTSFNGSRSSVAHPYCQGYVQDLAKRLNVSTSSLEQSQTQAFEDVMTQMVRDGKLTQKEATAIQANTEPRQSCTALDAISGKGATLFDLKQYLPGVADQVALGLHMTSSQLEGQLHAGKSLDSIAVAQRVSVSNLHTIEANAIRSALNKAVSAHDITDQQAKSILQKWQSDPQLLDSLLKLVTT